MAKLDFNYHDKNDKTKSVPDQWEMSQTSCFHPIGQLQQSQTKLNNNNNQTLSN